MSRIKQKGVVDRADGQRARTAETGIPTRRS